MARQDLLQDRDSKLYYQKNGTMILLNRQKHPLFFNWLERHYGEVNVRYENIHKDRLTGLNVWVYFTDESYAKLQQELGIKENNFKVTFASNVAYLVVANYEKYLADSKLTKLARSNKRMRAEEPLYKIDN